MNFHEYYQTQSGSGLPVFHGSKYQRGSGLGNIFKSFYRWIVPVLKTHALPVLKDGAQVVGTEALRTFKNIANDTLDGEQFKSSLKRRTKEAVNSLTDRAEEALQTGNGYKRRRKRRPRKKKRICRKKKRKTIKRKTIKRKRKKPTKRTKKVTRKRKLSTPPKPKSKRSKKDILDEYESCS